MQPSQPIPPPYSGGNQPYDFILNGQQKPKKSLIPSLPQGNSRKQRLLIIGGLFAGVLILLIVIVMLIMSSTATSTDSILKVAQTQNEIIRVSDKGAQDARDLNTQGFSQTVMVTMTSAQQETLKYLATQRVKPKEKLLAANFNSKTDEVLKSAAAAQRYDEELRTILKQFLQEYQTQVSTAYKATKDPAQKKLLQNLYNQVTTLMKNQPATSS